MAQRSLGPEVEQVHLNFPSQLVADLDAWAEEIAAQSFGVVSRSSLIRGILSKAVEEHKAARKRKK